MLNLRSYLTLDDTTTGKKKDASTQGRPSATGGLFKLNQPHVRIHRGNGYLETLPPAVSFWETFGLEPLLGRKDVLPFCIFPENTAADAAAFMERMGSTYSTASLGGHSTFGDSDGLIPWALTPGVERDYRSLLLNLQDVFKHLGR
jgi:mediator of RNA polymerase II transcription subunit 13